MKSSIKQLRRREIIEAAYRVFLNHGLDGLSTARICKEAGMSPGIITYYFKGKDEVLFWMVRHANNVIMNEVVAQMGSANTRWERLTAIIRGNFPDHLFTRNTASAWVSFYASTTRNDQFAKLQSLFHRRLGTNLRSCVSNLLDKGEMAEFVLGVGILIDGCWLRRGIANSAMTAEDAISLIGRHIENQLGPDRVRTLQEPHLPSSGPTAT